MVQTNAMKVWDDGGSFLDYLKEDKAITKALPNLESLFDLEYHTKHIDTIFQRVFK